MKKLLLLSALALSTIILVQCSSTRKATAAKPTYTNNIQPIVMEKCTPCHIPEKGGRVKALDTYDAVKGDVEDIIRRIELHPGDRGYMPFKKPRLSDSTITVFKQWRDEGLKQ